METPIPLSVIVLTKNEAGRIRECIESVRWAGEILVVDDESTDGTVALAEQLGARVVRRRMENEGRHRNWAAEQARYEWILSVDADERVTPELAQELQQLLRQETQPHETYAIPRRNFIGTRWIRYGGWYPSAQLKLFKRSVFRWEETTVHPRAISQSSFGTLHGDILHYSYRDLADFIEKQNRQTSLEAQKWILDGRRMPLPKALWRSADRFFRAYLSKQGYRDGFLGFTAAWLGGLYQFLAWAKYWEQTRSIHVEDIVAPFNVITVDQERYDRALLMSHLCAYQKAAEYVKGKRMLEIGCGAGYGAYFLSHVAAEVTAIDMDGVVIEQAQRMFRRPNLTYRHERAVTLPFPGGAFDGVGLFQVIEHIPEPQLPVFVKELARVLAPEGVCVISTLNLTHNQKNARYQKPSFHEKEFTAPELEALLKSAFSRVEMLGLYPRARYRLNTRLKRWGMNRWGSAAANPVKRFFSEELRTGDHVLREECSSRAIDLIAICRR